MKNNNNKTVVGVLAGAVVCLGGALYMANASSEGIEGTGDSLTSTESMYQQMLSAGYKQDYDTWLADSKSEAIKYRMVDLNVEYGANDQWTRMYSLENIVNADGWYSDFSNGSLDIEFDQYYSVNFSTGVAANVSSQVVLSGEYATSPGSIGDAGKTFLGWDYDFAEPITKTTYVNATWENRSYYLTFNTNGGESIAQQKVVYEDVFSLPTPERYGFVFEGWYYGNDYFNEGIWTYSQNVTLTAKWSTTTYQMSFDSNGGTYVTDLFIDYMDSFSLPTPTRSGYKFGGWYCGDTYVGTSGTYIYEDNVTLTAKWVAEGTDFLTFDSNGGSEHAPIEVKMDYSYSLPTPTKTGYTFTGWSVGGENLDSSKVWAKTGDYTAVAQWTPTSYKITYVMNSGTNSSSNPTTYTIETERTLITPTRAHCTFAGWLVNGVHYDTFELDGHTGALEIEALWEYIYYDVYYYVDGELTETINADKYNPLEISFYYLQKHWDGDSYTANWYYDSVYTGYYTYLSSGVLSKWSDYATNGIHLYGKSVVQSQSVEYSKSTYYSLMNYGSYPQTVVQNKTLREKLLSLTETNEQGYYELDGHEYERLVVDPGSSSAKWGNSFEIVDGSVEFFKVEPIVWRVLTDSDGTKEVITNLVIDAGAYNTSAKVDSDGVQRSINDWEYSDSREYLNNSFYNRAFNTTQQNGISNTTYTKYNVQTTDKVYFISSVTNSNYGFAISSGYECSRREIKPTDYAKAKNLYVYSSPSGCVKWWYGRGSADGGTYVYFALTKGNSSSSATNTMGYRPCMELEMFQ
ncbi:MAG: InlB B-repeat-containing protein [bacterium]